MPRYNYECSTCLQKLDGEPSKEIYESEVLFETSHSMNPTEDELYAATECPRCGGHDCRLVIYDCNIHSYIRGYGWLDKAGIKRDMNKHTLLNDDPYGQYRTPGEVEHIKSKLEKSGKHDPKTKYYPIASSDVEKVVAGH
jgi:DNA-directed RNA polymerase subunit RPC12/RpoP